MARRSSVYDPDRLNAFSDGIFAFAATLLVLQFTVPDAEVVKKVGLTDALAQTNFVSDVVTFVLSFLVVTIYRSAHQRVFSNVEHIDGMVSRLNTFFLMSIAFLPFATALFSNYARQISFNLYAGTLAASGFLLIATSVYARSNPVLTPRAERRSGKALIRDAAPPVIFLLSIPLSYLIGPEKAAFSWILIAVADQALRLLLGDDEDDTARRPTAAEADQAQPS